MICDYYQLTGIYDLVWYTTVMGTFRYMKTIPCCSMTPIKMRFNDRFIFVTRILVFIIWDLCIEIFGVLFPIKHSKWTTHNYTDKFSLCIIFCHNKLLHQRHICRWIETPLLRDATLMCLLSPVLLLQCPWQGLGARLNDGVRISLFFLKCRSLVLGKSLQLIRGSSTRGFHPLVLNLQISYNDFI